MSKASAGSSMAFSFKNASGRIKARMVVVARKDTQEGDFASAQGFFRLMHIQGNYNFDMQDVPLGFDEALLYFTARPATLKIRHKPLSCKMLQSLLLIMSIIV